MTLMVANSWTLTVLEDAHVLLLGQDGVVGIEAILLQHSFIAVGLSDVIMFECITKTRRTPSLFNTVR